MMPLKQFKSLHRLVDVIFEKGVKLDYSWEQLASRAGLCDRTVSRLGNLETLYPRAQTVFLLAHAVGMEISITDQRNGKKRRNG